MLGKETIHLQVRRKRLLRLVALLSTLGLVQCGSGGNAHTPDSEHYISYQVNPQKQAVRLYWKDDTGEKFRSIQRLQAWLEAKHQRLLFATNGGMYKSGNTPLGLYVEQGIALTPLDTASGTGNFYLKPNGVFYLTAKGEAGIVPTTAFQMQHHIQYATQSGPMLVLKGQIHLAFNARSTNLNIRNGVGILPDGTVLFAMSKEKVSLYNFAAYFQRQGCQTALYLDGFVSRTYLPEQDWRQTDGDFGVIIGVKRPSR
ncbi:phosphodiester glycosidase family protein [Hymenobacter wooponensis]|uniref:Phosphodiester glycosidase domain-containing protein n=1 Tax=Hymenobacter wooponensis TaxID=1525360 RepID=A0A4Z0MKE0_9BACT|nr:phosphodiester glycosidase family protein [Hymenobacter wooponensis]TGD79859.1 hypothetical protein EU557_16745 [Hymenobacter wooponensis]